MVNTQQEAARAVTLYLIRLHRRVLDHHALHLVAHIALLVASEREVGCWLHAHYGLVAGRRVGHHGLVHWRGERGERKRKKKNKEAQ